MSSYDIKHCLCCNSSKLELVLDLAMQPLANNYSKNQDELIDKFPLALNVCVDCWHSQLSYCVDRKLIFDNYNYISGTSKTLNNYFRWFAHEISNLSHEGSKILEVAANDGSLLKEMDKLGLEVIGIDPAENIVISSSNKGINLICGYWPEDTKKIEGNFDIIICMNVLAHVDTPKEFLYECKNKLTQDGIIIIQPSQARMFGNSEFDTCYHEHISFFNTSSIKALAFRVGLKLIKTCLVDIHGDSPIYILSHIKSERKINDHAFKSLPFGIQEKLEDYELKIKLFQKSTYDLFSLNSRSILKNLKDNISNFKSKDFDIVFVGAAAKAMTVINSINVVPDYFLDESNLKIGLYPAGLPTKIQSFEICRILQKPVFLVITAWNFRSEISEKIINLGLPKGSIIYTYFPSSEIICEL